MHAGRAVVQVTTTPAPTRRVAWGSPGVAAAKAVLVLLPAHGLRTRSGWVVPDGQGGAMATVTQPAATEVDPQYATTVVRCASTATILPPASLTAVCCPDGATPVPTEIPALPATHRVDTGLDPAL